MTDTEAIPRPLVATSDAAVLDEILRLCAAAGVTPEVASDVGQARRSWNTASCVVIGHDRLDALVDTVDRRGEVVIVADDLNDRAVWAAAVNLGAEAVYVLPDDESDLVDLLAVSADGADRDAVTIGVLGGVGGAGASTFAAALAVTASRNQRSTLLIDADPLGGGIDMVVGNEHVRGLRWPELATTRGRVSGEALRQVLPHTTDLAVLSWDRGEPDTVAPESMRSLLAAGCRSHDVLVVDVPRSLDGAAEEALVRADVVLLLVPAEVRAVAGAQRTLARVRSLCSDIRLIVRGPGAGGLGPDFVENAMAVPLLTSMRPDRRLAEHVDHGHGPLSRRRSPLTAACTTALHDLRILGEEAA